MIVNNLRQATTVLSELTPKLRGAMHSLSIDSEDIFHSWIDEEQHYLTTLPDAPICDVLTVNLFDTLLQLEQAR